MERGREVGSILLLLSLSGRPRPCFFFLITVHLSPDLFCFVGVHLRHHRDGGGGGGLTVFVLPACGTIAHARREQFLIEKAPLKKMIWNEGEGGEAMGLLPQIANQYSLLATPD